MFSGCYNCALAGVCALHHKAVVKYALGFADQAQRSIERASELSNEISHLPTRSHCRHFSAWLAFFRADTGVGSIVDGAWRLGRGYWAPEPQTRLSRLWHAQDKTQGSRPPRPRLRLVHRGVRYRRFEGGEGLPVDPLEGIAAHQPSPLGRGSPLRVISGRPGFVRVRPL